MFLNSLGVTAHALGSSPHIALRHHSTPGGIYGYLRTLPRHMSSSHWYTGQNIPWIQSYVVWAGSCRRTIRNPISSREWIHGLMVRTVQGLTPVWIGSVNLREHSVHFREHSVHFREHSVNFREHSVNFREHSVNFREHSVNFREHSVNFCLLNVLLGPCAPALLHVSLSFVLSLIS